MSVQVAAVLEDFTAEGAAINPLVLSGFVPPLDGRAIGGREQAAAL